jgi:hypothetical protein
MTILNEEKDKEKSGWDLSVIDAILEDPTYPDLETDETEKTEGQKCPNCGAPWAPIIGCSRCSLSPEDLS